MMHPAGRIDDADRRGRQVVLRPVTAENSVTAATHVRRVIAVHPVLHQEFELSLDRRLVGDKDQSSFFSIRCGVARVGIGAAVRKPPTDEQPHKRVIGRALVGWVVTRVDLPNMCRKRTDSAVGIGFRGR